MLVLKSKKELQSTLASLDLEKGLGLVPTMGALHEGHIALVNRALDENSYVVVSIFVNPTQFNNSEDLKKYPQTLDADVAMLKKVSSKILVFAPTVKEIYNTDISSKSYDFAGLDKVMEGAFRDDHFDGVGTIVEILLRTVQPNKAYFGEKDFQQLQIIKKLVEHQKIPVAIIGCPIVRESNGLALSSRNKRLSNSMRAEAAFIYKTLSTAKRKFGTKSAKKITEWMETEFKNHPNLKLEYVEIVDADSLAPVLRKQKNKKYRVFVAVYADDVRLIDNIALN